MAIKGEGSEEVNHSGHSEGTVARRGGVAFEVGGPAKRRVETVRIYGRIEQATPCWHSRLMGNKKQYRRGRSWVILPIGWGVGLVAFMVLSQPVRERLERVKRELSVAGYPGAQVSRIQIPSNMARCDVSQVSENRGYAYGWETDGHSGVFCLPTDGRPTRILLD